MSMQKVVERILSDAQAESEEMLRRAEKKAEEIINEAHLRAEKNRAEVELEVKKKTESIFEKRDSDARLESAKIVLGEKRKTVEGVYALARARLLALEKEDVLRLYSRLLETYAETGDELFFAENFAFASEVERLPVVKQKGLKIAEKRLSIDGGLKLVGKISDKDLSYSALLEADKEENQANLAKQLFK